MHLVRHETMIERWCDCQHDLYPLCFHKFDLNIIVFSLNLYQFVYSRDHLNCFTLCHSIFKTINTIHFNSIKKTKI